MALISNKKKIVFALICIVVVVAILGAAACFVSYISNYSLGVVTQISVKQKSIDTLELRIKYLLPSGGYSVRAVSEDEGEYCGDGTVDYDGALGKYRIMVNFGDVALSDLFAGKADEDGVIKLTEDIRARVAMPSDHGFVLYIGADHPLDVENSEHGELNSPGGTVNIPICVENTK